MLASHVVGLIFLALIVFLTVVQYPPKNVLPRIKPMLTAIVGSFFLIFLLVLPTAPMIGMCVLPALPDDSRNGVVDLVRCTISAARFQSWGVPTTSRPGAICDRPAPALRC